MGLDFMDYLLFFGMIPAAGDVHYLKSEDLWEKWVEYREEPGNPS